MTDEVLRHIKDEFGLTLPDTYTAFMRAYPSELETTKLDLGWCQEAISERYLLKNPEKILDLNRGVREPGYQWVEGAEGWPNHFFIIGDDMCGNYYAIDCRNDSTAVFFYDHETWTFTVEAESIDAYRDKTLRDTLEFNGGKG